MIMPKTRNLIEEATEVELENALAQGTIVDAHHAYAILKEEIEKAITDTEKLPVLLTDFWTLIKYREASKKEQAAVLLDIKVRAECAIHEIAQIIAVIKKIEKQIYHNEIQG